MFKYTAINVDILNKRDGTVSHFIQYEFSNLCQWIKLIPLLVFFFSKTVIIAGGRNKEILSSPHEAFGIRLWRHESSTKKLNTFFKNHRRSVFLIYLNFYIPSTQRQMDCSPGTWRLLPFLSVLVSIYHLLTEKYSNISHFVSDALIPHPFLSFINT